jgi:major vault protein
MLGKINGAELERQKATANLDIETAKQRLDQRLEALQAEVQAMVAKAEAISPDFIAALQAFGDKALAERMAESMAPLAILGGKSVAEVLSSLLKGTKLETIMLKQPPQI